MINRVLIRIKVVQILYSYLLNRSDFKIAPPPSDNSRDSRYAYSLYLDLLLLVIQLSGLEVKAGKVGRASGLHSDPKLSAGKLAKALLSNDQILSTVTRDAAGVDIFEPLLPALLAKIEGSVVFKDYKAIAKPTIKDDAKLWEVVLTTIIERDPQMLEAASQNPAFTHRGFERAFAMATSTLNGLTENRTAAIEARNSLDRSFDKAYELYHMLLWLCVDITDMQARRLDEAKHKFLPTPDDLNPNMRFVDNAFVAALRNNHDMLKYIDATPLNWTDDDEVMVRHLLDKILESEIYAEYMAAPSTDYENDCELWRKLYRRVILQSDDLVEALESRSVYWNDDLDTMGTFVLKTIKHFAASQKHGKDVKLLPQYKDAVDRRFGPELFNDSMDHYEEYRQMVERFTATNWDIERVAFIDVVILVVAISEIINFPEIPIPVTVNEYVEIANAYSTRKSGQFINGMLSTIINHLRAEGKISK